MQSQNTQRRAELFRSVRKAIGKCSAIRCEQTIADIIAVASRVKPAALIDQIAVDAAQLRVLLRILQVNFACVSLSDLAIVSLGDMGASFVVHAEALCSLQQKVDDLLIINVTSNLPCPEHVCTRDAIVGGGEWYSAILDVLRDFARQLRYTGKGEEVSTDSPGSVRSSRTIDHFAEEGPTITVVYPPTVNLTTLYGFILGYPCLYWYDHLLSSGNCLSMIPLRLYECVFDAPDPTVESSDNWFRSGPYRFTSFSIPEIVATDLGPVWEQRVRVWEQQLQEYVQNSFLIWIADQCDMRQITVELAQVAL